MANGCKFRVSRRGDRVESFRELGKLVAVRHPLLGGQSLDAATVGRGTRGGLTTRMLLSRPSCASIRILITQWEDQEDLGAHKKLINVTADFGRVEDRMAISTLNCQREQIDMMVGVEEKMTHSRAVPATTLSLDRR